MREGPARARRVGNETTPTTTGTSSRSTAFGSRPEAQRPRSLLPNQSQESLQSQSWVGRGVREGPAHARRVGNDGPANHSPQHAVGRCRVATQIPWRRECARGPCSLGGIEGGELAVRCAVAHPWGADWVPNATVSRARSVPMRATPSFFELQRSQFSWRRHNVLGDGRNVPSRRRTATQERTWYKYVITPTSRKRQYFVVVIRQGEEPRTRP